MESQCVAEWFLSSYEPVPFQCHSMQQSTVILLVKVLSEHFPEMKMPRWEGCTEGDRVVICVERACMDGLTDHSPDEN